MPRLEYDPEVGLTAPETAELRDAVAANWQEAFKKDGRPLLDVDPSTPAGQLIDSEASFLAETNAEILRISNQLNPRLAEGPWQDALGYIYFLDRKVAYPTRVTVTCTGLQGTVIPAGAQVQTKDGDRYECIAETVIPEEGTIDVDFLCTKPGPTECLADALMNYIPDDLVIPQIWDPDIEVPGAEEPGAYRDRTDEEKQAYIEEYRQTLGSIVTVVPGWDTIRNEEAGTPGWLRESQWDFEARRFESVAKNAHGTVESLQGTLWNVDGVTDCRVLENPTGATVVKHGVAIAPHSVAISVKGGDRTGIAKAIYEKKDAGCGTCLGEKSEWCQMPSGADPTKPPYSYKGAVESVDDLPETADAFDVYRVTGTVPARNYFYSVYSGFTRITYSDGEFSGASYEYGIIVPEDRGVAIRVTYQKTPFDSDNPKAEIQNAVYADFNGQNKDSGNVRVGCCQTLYASRFAVAVVKTAGIANLVSIEVAFAVPEEQTPDWGSSIVIDGWTEPVLEKDQIKVVPLG